MKDTKHEALTISQAGLLYSWLRVTEQWSAAGEVVAAINRAMKDAKVYCVVRSDILDFMRNKSLVQVQSTIKEVFRNQVANDFEKK